MDVPKDHVVVLMLLGHDSTLRTSSMQASMFVRAFSAKGWSWSAPAA